MLEKLVYFYKDIVLIERVFLFFLFLKFIKFLTYKLINKGKVISAKTWYIINPYFESEYIFTVH